MRPIRTFTVVPALPPPLEPLREIAMNLRWAWHHDSIALFRRLSAELWTRSGRNPLGMLALCEQQLLEEAADDEEFLAHLDRVHTDLRRYLDERETWYEREHGDGEETLVAYFSAEFGVTDAVKIFAGGLGMLAGDHLKSASDLGIPLVGVGLLYQEGYFAQQLNEAGWQQEVPATNTFDQLPLTLERDDEGEPITVELGFPDGPCVAQIWRADVGRVPLYLLDANVPANNPEQRRVTAQLYGGGEEMRVRQEILLGIGGYRALEALGHEPRVYHMNEGHSAFLALERIRRLIEQHDVSFDVAREMTTASCVFTTHTPVEAGHDYFDADLLARYFSLFAKSLGTDWDTFLGLGRQDPDDETERFCMTVLALRLSARANGVSRLHGEVSREMWQALWPGLPADEVPIGHVTNGVHLASWLSPEASAICDERLGERWREEPTHADVWRMIDDIPDDVLWRTHEARRRRLVGFVRERVAGELERRGAPGAEVAAVEHLLDPHALTIGFARRFATYKRATLFARDRERLARILGDPDRPVQLVIAGKAHPRDDAGKELIRQVVELSREEPFRSRIVFVENYGMSLARRLVAGCDVWLNNPIRPREASGTSGMKAAANGILNLSTLDGWWDEAWADLGWGSAPFGWAIGRRDIHLEGEALDHYEAASLYDLLEHDVVPAFYDRGDDGIPHSWVARMKSAIVELSPRFNTHRMLSDYVDEHYRPATRAAHRIVGSLDVARELAAWRSRVLAGWSQVWCRADGGAPDAADEIRIGEELAPRAHVQLGDLDPDDVTVELYLGPVGPGGTIESGEIVEMAHAETVRDGEHVYEARAVQPSRSGRHGYTVRVRASNEALSDAHVPGCVTWAEADAEPTTD